MTLDQRAVEVLRIVIEEHVKSGEPVSSRRTARLHAEQLSPATIRNIMADLTEDGYLEQPHTSAGRVPTEQIGVRFGELETLSLLRTFDDRELYSHGYLPGK